MLAIGGVALLAGMLAAHVVFGANGMITYMHKRMEYRKLQGEIQQLQQENNSLQQQVNRLRSDPEAIEKEAREKLRYARPGETIYTLAAPPTPPPNNLKAQK
jgi:cell division protein FtsB